MAKGNCPFCDGWGETYHYSDQWGDFEIDCDFCDGTGNIDPEAAAEIRKVENDERQQAETKSN